MNLNFVDDFQFIAVFERAHVSFKILVAVSIDVDAECFKYSSSRNVFDYRRRVMKRKQSNSQFFFPKSKLFTPENDACAS